VKAQGIFLVVCGWALAASAQQSQPSDFETSRSTEAPRKKHIGWDDPEWWEAMRKKPEGMPLGKTDIVVTGPIADTFRRRPRKFSELTFEQKLNSIPIVNLFIPQPMHVAPRDRGKYFAWNESDTPWVNRMSGDIARPPGTLLNVNW
jgi:hypothetical protein